MLRAKREARYGNSQATVGDMDLGPLPSKTRKLIPYAGAPKGNANAGRTRAPVDKSPEAVAARKAVAAKRKPRKAKTT